VDVEQLDDGLWWWTSRLDGGGERSSLYLEADDAISLFDPRIPPEDDERFLRALDRDVERHGGPVHVFLSMNVYRGEAVGVVERYGALVVTAPRTHAVEALDAGKEGCSMFWIPRRRTLFAADALLAAADGSIVLAPDRDRTRLAASIDDVLRRGADRIVCSTGRPVAPEWLI
jgi:hypothetical protein